VENVLKLRKEIHNIFVATSHVQPLQVVDSVLAHKQMAVQQRTIFKYAYCWFLEWCTHVSWSCSTYHLLEWHGSL